MVKRKVFFAFSFIVLVIGIFSAYKVYLDYSSKIKIFITFHKPYQLPQKGDILIPIHVGRSVEDQAFFGGQLSQDDIDWLHKNMIGDNTDDNISHKNRMFDVLTAYYYVWKHYKEIGNPDYIGFMAHRKILITNPNKYRKFNRSAPNYGYNEDELLPLLKKHKVITIHTLSYDELEGYPAQFPIYEYYGRHHHIEDMDEMIRLIKTYYPEMIDTMNEVLHKPRKEYAVWNFWIMKKELAFEYFEKLFKLAFEIEKNRGNEIQNYDIAQQRAIGYLAERFFAIWLEYKIKTEKISPFFVRAQYL